MRDEHADVWPGFGSAQVEHFFGEAGLEGYDYESLGIHHYIPSTSSAEIADIGIFAARGRVCRGEWLLPGGRHARPGWWPR
jgi:hypothetical protein